MNSRTEGTGGLGIEGIWRRRGRELSREGVESSRSQQSFGHVYECLPDDLFIDRVSFSAGRYARHTLALRQVTDGADMRKRCSHSEELPAQPAARG